MYQAHAEHLYQQILLAFILRIKVRMKVIYGVDFILYEGKINVLRGYSLMPFHLFIIHLIETLIK